MTYKSVLLGSMSSRQIKGMIGHDKLVTRLSKSTVTKFSQGNGQISFKYDGQMHTFKVFTKPHVPWVGTWDKRKLFLDDDIRYTKDIYCLSVHEAVESYVARKYGIDRDYTAHYIATAVEKAFARNIRQNWDDYQMRTEFVFRKEENWRK
jgi:hypothetical protein